MVLTPTSYYSTPTAIAEAWEKEGGYVRKNEVMNKRKCIWLFNIILGKLRIEPSLYKSESASGKNGIFIFGSENPHDEMKKLFELYDRTNCLDAITLQEKQELKKLLVNILPTCKKVADVKTLFNYQDTELRKLIFYLDEISKLKIITECQDNQLMQLFKRLNKLKNVHKSQYNLAADIIRKEYLQKQAVENSVDEYYAEKRTVYFFERRIFIIMMKNEYKEISECKEFYRYQFRRINEWYQKWKIIISYIENNCKILKEKYEISMAENFQLFRLYSEILEEYNRSRDKIILSTLKEKNIKGKDTCLLECRKLVEIICDDGSDKNPKVSTLRRNYPRFYNYIVCRAFEELEEIHKELEMKLGRKIQTYEENDEEKENTKNEDCIYETIFDLPEENINKLIDAFNKK